MSNVSRSEGHTNSAGMGFTAGDWLDLHYQVAQPEYLTLLRAARLHAGWRILDAGCGSGSFLPAIAEQLGPDGHISAIDLASEHITAIQKRITAQPLACPVEARTGSLLDLPYPSGSFDAIWSANVTQYLTDDELRAALAECMRVLKPNGLLAIKDADGTLMQFLPIPPTLLWRFLNLVAQNGHVQTLGILRTLRLAEYLSEAGFTQVARTTICIERSSPLHPAEAQYLEMVIATFAAAASALELSEADYTAWRTYGDPDSPGYILRQPDIFMRDGNVLVVGHKPAA